MGEISITKLLVVAALIVLVFGTKKLRTLGGDLGSAIKGFKKAMGDDEEKKDNSAQDADFTAKSISDKPDDAKKDGAKSHDKEQV